MKKYSLDTLSPADRARLLRRPYDRDGQAAAIAETIFASVAEAGDRALRRWTNELDHANPASFRISPGVIGAAADDIPPPLKGSIAEARDAIERFHRAQLPPAVTVETMAGVVCRREWRPLGSVGLYIPGGTAPLVSTVLMLGVPAVLAGCPRIALCSPPRRDGTIAREILFAASSLGITEIYALGGAQAVAALAIGTESVPRVDKIFGPGNRFVAAAKTIAAHPPYNTGIDLPAGPSELLIIADATADPALIAADLLSQAEHGEGSQVVLVSTSAGLIDAVRDECSRQCATLPRAAEVNNVWEKSYALLAPSLAEAISFANDYAPEHLQLAVADPGSCADAVRNAGSVFLGSKTSVVYGDYASGANHTLPTGGSARWTGGVTVESFLKSMTLQSVTDEGCRLLLPVVTALARAEGLEAHARAAEARRLP